MSQSHCLILVSALTILTDLSIVDVLQCIRSPTVSVTYFQQAHQRRRQSPLNQTFCERIKNDLKSNLSTLITSQTVIKHNT